MEKIITKTKLTKDYDEHASVVFLSGCLPFLTVMKKTHKGERTRYEVVRALPSKETYLEMKNRYYSTTIGELVSSVYNDIVELKDELESWYDNMPESLQGGDKGQILQDSISCLDSVYEPDVDENISKISVVFVPRIPKRYSRSERHSLCVDILEFVSSTLKDALDSDGSLEDSVMDLLADIEETLMELQNVEYPGMF